MALPIYPHTQLGLVSTDVLVTSEPTRPPVVTVGSMKLGSAPGQFSLSESKTLFESASCAAVNTTERTTRKCVWLPTRYARRIHSGRRYSHAAGPAQSEYPNTTVVSVGV